MKPDSSNKPEHQPVFPLVDIGANLSNRSFDDDLPAVLERAISAGVSTIIVTGTSLLESQRAIELVEKYSNHLYPSQLYCTAGVHPHDASSFAQVNHQQKSYDELKAMCLNPAVKAIGECGLDFNRMYSPRDQQISAFEQQLELATELKLPIFLHEREAHQTQLEVLHNYHDKLTGAVAHCFTGSREEAFNYLDLGLSIGITGWICDDKRGAHLREFVSDIPLDRLMIETDAPYLMPKVKPKPQLPSSRRNEPCTLPYVLAEIARNHSASIEDIAAATTRNALAFFNIVQA